MTNRYQIIQLWCVVLLVGNATFVAASERETPEVRAVQRALASVGNIHTEKPANKDPQNQIFATKEQRKINGMGTGIVLDERGYMVTNYHVIADVDTIRVEFHDNSSYIARRVTVDKENDLAIIKIDPLRPLQVMPLGTSSDLMLAEKVIAIGNAFGYQGTITIGYISALGRNVEANEGPSYRNLIQTDAAINPGNSGGPLINIHGEVIGINVAIRANSQKIGFAIPIDDARKAIARLLNIEHLERTYHGLISKDIKNATTRMLIVDGVHPDSPAAVAGLKAGDVILKAGHLEVVDGADWERAFLGHSIGEKIEISLKRNERMETALLSLAPYAGGRSNISLEHALRTRANPEPVLPKSTVSPLEEQYWHQLGMRFAPLPVEDKSLTGTKYRGGLRVLDVQPDSQAALNGIQANDVLVGLDKWETLSLSNVEWILNQTFQSPADSATSMKFYIVRSVKQPDGARTNQTLYGQLPMGPTRVATALPPLPK